MLLINMVTQPRINLDIEITLVAVKFHSQVLFYNVDFQIDLWSCLKVTHITAKVLPQCCWPSRRKPPHPCFESRHSCFEPPEMRETFIICCFNTAINLKPVTTSVTIIFIKNSYLCLDFCRPHHHCAIYHSLLLSHLALKFLKHKYFKLLKQIYSKFSPLF